MLDDLGDPASELRAMKKAIERVQSSAGDSGHRGTGTDSVQIGPFAESTGYGSVSYGDHAFAWADSASALGPGSKALQDNATALGSSAYSNNEHSTAVGADATTDATYQVMLGTSSDAVVVPGSLEVFGTFSNPSARRLKRNIIPAPTLRDIFPELTEWEYIDGDGKRRLGYIADDLVGTDAERFVTLDRDGEPAGIDYLGLLVAQVARLSTELAALKDEMKG